MQMHDQDEFRKAFMTDDEAAADTGAENTDAVVDEAAEAVGDAADNAPTEGAAEGASDTPAVAVVIDGDGAEGKTEEGPAAEAGVDDDSDVSPEEMQAYKSWKGRLKKREEELAAREAALAEKESPVALADGGEIKDEAGALDLSGNEGKSGEAGEAAADEGAEAVDIDSLKAEAAEMAGDPERLRAVLNTMVADYGREYVVGLMAAMSPMIDAMAQPYVAGVDSQLGSLIDDVTEAFRSMHRATIADAHEDFEQIVDSPEFQAWIDGLPEEDKAKAQATVDTGSAGKIIKLLQAFKDSLKASKEPSPEDIWDMDAASGVKNSAPLRIPTRAPASPDDEYRRAWDMA